MRERSDLRLPVALLVSCFALAARAEPPREIALVAPAGALQERVRIELQALGFSVRHERPRSVGAARDALARPDATPADRWALELEPVGDTVRVTVHAGERGEREEQFRSGASAGGASLAIRIAEFARAVLFAGVPDASALAGVRVAVPAGVPDAALADVPAAPPAAPDAPALADVEATAPPAAASAPSARPALPAAAPPPAAPPAAAKAALEVGFAALGGPGGLGAGYGLALAVGGFVTRAWRLGASAFAPLSAQAHSAGEGSSRSRVTLITADLRGEFRTRARFRPTLGGGVGAAVLSTQGRGAAPDYAGADSRRASAGAYLRAGGGYYFAPRFALRLDLTLGAQFSRFALSYAERERAQWGVPWFMGAGGVEIALP